MWIFLRVWRIFAVFAENFFRIMENISKYKIQKETTEHVAGMQMSDSQMGGGELDRWLTRVTAADVRQYYEKNNGDLIKSQIKCFTPAKVDAYIWIVSQDGSRALSCELSSAPPSQQDIEKWGANPFFWNGNMGVQARVIGTYVYDPLLEIVDNKPTLTIQSEEIESQLRDNLPEYVQFVEVPTEERVSFDFLLPVYQQLLS